MIREIRPCMFPHQKYSDDPSKQKAVEDGVEAITASILELIAPMIQQRLSQFAALTIESIEKERTND